MIKQLHNYSFGTVIPFVMLHVGCIAVLFVPFRWSWVGLMLATYAVRMFGITAGYHRYLQPPQLQIGARLAILDGVSGGDVRAEGRAVVGCPSSRSSSACRQGAGYSFSLKAWVLVGSRRVGTVERVRQVRLGADPRLRQISGITLAGQTLLGSPGSISSGSANRAAAWGPLCGDSWSRLSCCFTEPSRSILWPIFGDRGGSTRPTTAAITSSSPSSHSAKAGTTTTTSSCMRADREFAGGKWTLPTML